VMDHFADGVYFVEFAPVSDARMVPQALASVLGVKEEAGHPVIEALVRYARDHKLLLIFDNCEHLVQACAELANTLLRAAPGLHILASSREPLRIDGEACYPVSSLSVPDAVDRDIAGESLAMFEAAQLFVERAMAVQPSFRLTDDNSAAVADVCRRLDGIPLAIELAAARTRTMSAVRIAERLSDRFRLLAAGDRTALPRQQTLRALIDWSYDLLTEPEQALLRRLAVFAGGFTVEAAEAVGQGDCVAESDVLDVLTRLIEKSLVAFDAEKVRYSLLETVRQYAQDLQQESGNHAPAYARHLAFFLALAEQARAARSGPEHGKWLACMDAERENILSAHRYCDRADNGAEAGMQLAQATKHYWFNRGLLALGKRVAVEALSRPGADGRGILRCNVLLDAGQFCLWLGRYDEAEKHLQESLSISREAGLAEMVPAILQPLGLAALGRGDAVAARAALEEALLLARQQEDKRELAAALNQVAQADRSDGRMAEAAAHYAEALSLAREIGDLTIVAVTLLNLAMIAVIRHAPGEVAPALLETLAIADKTGDRLAGQSALDVCTGLAALRHEYVQAARFHGMADSQLRQSGMQRDPADRAFLAPWVADARRELAPAVFVDAQSAGAALAYSDAVAEARRWIAVG
jgi:predicted ATPase